MKLFIAFCFCIAVHSVYACSCVGKETPRQAKKTADMVVVGKIIESKRVAFYTPGFLKDSVKFMDYTFVVTEKYKGKLISDTLIIRTGFGHGDCGVNFMIGEEYIIYAKDAHKQNMRRKYPYTATDSNLRGVYETNICTRTKLLKNAEEDIRKLK